MALAQCRVFGAKIVILKKASKIQRAQISNQGFSKKVPNKLKSSQSDHKKVKKSP